MTMYANHVGNIMGLAAGAVCMTRRKTWHTVCLGREQARRSRGRSGRLRAVADARKRLHGASRPDIAGSGVGHGAIPLCGLRPQCRSVSGEMEDAVSRPCPPVEDVCEEKMQYCASSTES